jgi:pyrimidine-nucleoside phosphorylase
VNPVIIIQKKRDGQRLGREELASFMTDYVHGRVPDYQMAALAMAIYLQGMDADETAALTEVMLQSGATLSRGWRVDKHSTGGIGDKVSLVLAPLLACCGLKVPMLSGRGLGPSGGTLDKLEAIPGFRTNLSTEEIEQIVGRVGCVITGQTADLVPADKKLYALRDVTATVPSTPLITASIMSKKLAENLDALVLDVKWGSGAFMKTLEQARVLAKSLRDVGGRMGLKTAALITDMNQPLGCMAGNAVEVMEAVDTLCGRGPADLVELTLALGAELLLLVGEAKDLNAGREQLCGALDSGRGLEKFREMVRAQGGNPDAPLTIAPPTTLASPRDGYLAALDCEKIGYAVIALGGGRKQLCDSIDHSVGVQMLVRLGDRVSAGQPWINLLAHERGRDEATQLLNEAIHIADEPPSPLPLVAERFAPA